MESKKPLISILMTAFNRERYIGSAIESVLSSTYTNFELIIVDDGSTDGTVSIVNEFIRKDNRIKLFINERNLGDYPNRNYAASLANGKYIKYVDSDDFIYPHGIEVMVSSMEKYPEAGWGICSLKADKIYPFPFMLEPKSAYEYHFFGPGLFHKGPLTTIFKKSVFEDVNGFNPGRMISDADMWHKLGLIYPVVLMQDGLVWQRLHDDQELNDQSNYIVDGARIKWKYLLDPKCPLTHEQLLRIKNSRVKRYAGFILSGLKRLDFKKAQLYFICLKETLKIKIK